MQKILTTYETGVRRATVELQDVTPPDSVSVLFKLRSTRRARTGKRPSTRPRSRPTARSPRPGAKRPGRSPRPRGTPSSASTGRAGRPRASGPSWTSTSAPQVTRRRLYLEAMSAVLPEAKALYIVDGAQKTLIPWFPWRRRQSRSRRRRRVPAGRREAAMKTALKVGLGLLLAIPPCSPAGLTRWRRVSRRSLCSLAGPGGPVTQGGLQVKLPFIQEVRRFEKRLLIREWRPKPRSPTRWQSIGVDTTARWRIADAKKFLESVATEAGAQSRLNDVSRFCCPGPRSRERTGRAGGGWSASGEVPEGEVLEEVPPRCGGADEGGHSRPRGADPDHPDRGPPGHPPIRDRTGGRADQAAQLRGERPGERSMPG